MVTVQATAELEYYLIMYKCSWPVHGAAGLKPPADREKLMRQPFAFAPNEPLILLEYTENLHVQWQQSALIDKLQAKATFYQLVCELLRQLQQQGVETAKPDLVTLAVRYIQEHYREPLTLDTIVEALECSTGHLSRLFKNKLHSSPIQYLGKLRSDRTAQLLLRTDATLQEIAEYVGFPDAHSLSRSFKKYKGLSPAHFREKQSGNAAGQNLPIQMREIAVWQNELLPYTDIENHFHQNVGRELFMQKRAKIAAMSLVMCFTILMGACSTSSNSSGNTPAAGTDQNAAGHNAAPTEQTEPAAATRTVSTLKGDVVVPAEPKRVVADQYMGHLLKLGITPVGVRSFMLTESWIDKAGISPELIAGIEDLGGFPMNLEKMTLMEPDLIIGSIEDNIEQYSKVGTTVFLPYWENESTADPLSKFRRISEVFGKEEEAEAWIKEYEAKVEQAKAKIAGIVKEGETVSVVQIGPKANFVLAAEGGNYGSNTIYQMLKLPPTEQALNMKEGFENVSLEVLPEYLGDHVFVYGSKDEGADEILNSAVWKGIPAVQKGQIYMYGSFGEKGDEFVMEDPYSLELQLETIVNLLLEKRQ
jgi:iron complex transport system substrate-binding protein